MVERMAIEFSIRCDATDTIEAMAGRLGSALNCRFEEGTYYRIPAYVSEVLGLRLGLLEWEGVAARPTFRLDGNIMDPRFAQLKRVGDVRVVDISQAVADILESRGAGAWRVPPSEELNADDEFERRMTELYDD